MNIQSVPVSRLQANPWRWSSDRALGVSDYEKSTPILENITTSLQEWGQLAPIHVRPVDSILNVAGAYEILDGHLVAEAAKLAGLEYLDVVMHLDVDDVKARLMYIHFNLNRGGQYGERHIKIMKVFKEVGSLAAVRAHTSWPESRIQDYIDIDTRGDSWRKFMFATDRGGAQPGQEAILGMEEQETPDF